MTEVAIMIAYAELDPGVVNAQMPGSAMAIYDELCGSEDAVGNCPTMLMAMDHSHMSEVFSIGSEDTTVSAPILEWIRSVE